MAELKRKTDTIEVKIVQWSNDWFKVDHPDKKGMVVSPMRLKLNESELVMVRESIANSEAGQMGNWFTLKDDGTFRRTTRFTNEDF